MKKIVKIVVLTIAGLVMVAIPLALYNDIKPIAFSIHDPVYQSSGKALGGFDAVSYFRDGPVQGMDAYSLEWNSVTWHFSSEENKKMFSANPEKYVPEFGGYCTKAISTGFTAPANPAIYVIWNEKLFIFSNDEVKAEFVKEPGKIISACSEHWD